MRTVTTPVIHFNPDLAGSPIDYTDPMSPIGVAGQNFCKRRRGRNWAATIDPTNVTCKRCRQLLMRGDGDTMEKTQFICKCACGGDVRGVESLGVLFSWCMKCTPVTKIAGAFRTRPAA